MIDSPRWRHLRSRPLADNVLLAEIDVAGQPINVMMPELIEELDALVSLVEATGTTGVVVASGKSSGFMAGADLKSMPTMFGQDIPAEGIGGVSRSDLVFAKNFRFNQALRRLETGSATWVAAINGVALGGGLELALACRSRVASVRPEVRVGLPEVSVGLMPGAGGTQRLTRLAGVEVALDWLLSGKPVRADAALRAGVIDEVVPDDQLIAVAQARAAECRPQLNGSEGVRVAELGPAIAAARSRAGVGDGHRYRAPWAIIEAVERGATLPIDDALALETRIFCDLVLHPQAEAMIDTLFVAKQAALRHAGRKIERVSLSGGGKTLAVLTERLRRAGAEIGDGADVTIVPAPDGQEEALTIQDKSGDESLAFYRSSAAGELLEIILPDQGQASGPAMSLAARLRAVPVEERTRDRPYVERCSRTHAIACEAARRAGWSDSLLADAIARAGLPTPAAIAADVSVNAPLPGDDVDVLGTWLIDAQLSLAEACLAEGLLGSETDANLAAVFGWGMPNFTGGPFGWRRQREEQS